MEENYYDKYEDIDTDWDEFYDAISEKADREMEDNVDD